MKDINSGKGLVNKVKNILKNYDFEIIAVETKSELTRFAESYIHQNVAETNLNLTVKVINEDRIGAVEMNSIDDHTISKNIEKAIEVTKITPKLDYHYQLLKPQSYKIKSKYSEQTAIIFFFRIILSSKSILSISKSSTKLTILLSL